MRGRLVRIWATFVFIALLHTTRGYAAGETYALIYPQATEATERIFQDVRQSIATGVSERGGRLIERSLPQNQDHRDAIRHWLAEVKPTLVIALGRTSVDALAGLERRYSIVAAMADLPPSENPVLSAVTLLPDPQALFETLRTLTPRTRRIFVVYDPARHQWLADLAARQAKSRNHTLVTLRADDVRAASLHFANIFRYANPETDALWIIDSQFAIDDTTLRVIVEESWLARFPVCSNAVQHLTRAILCTTFVPPALTGQLVLQLADERLAGRAPRTLVPREASRGINMRVASHLGIMLNSTEKRSFELVIGE
jgi:putative ABC transport system substrate-binding protein